MGLGMFAQKIFHHPKKNRLGEKKGRPGEGRGSGGKRGDIPSPKKPKLSRSI